MTIQKDRQQYRITKPDGTIIVEYMTTQEAYNHKIHGCQVELSFFGFWFPVSLGPVAL